MSWELCDSYFATNVNFVVNQSPKTFNNLQGDKYDYKLIMSTDGSTADTIWYMRINDDDATNYRSCRMQGLDTSNDKTSDNNATSIFFDALGDDNNGSFTSLSEIYIYGSTGNERLITFQAAYHYSTATFVHQGFGTWKVTDDEVTSIKLFTNAAGTSVSCRMYLFRQLKEVWKSPEWELIEEQNITDHEMGSLSGAVIFNNLKSNSVDEYLLVSEFDSDSGTDDQINLYFNNDTAGGMYKYQRLYINPTPVFGANVFDIPPRIGSGLYTANSFSTTHISPNPGAYPTIRIKSYTPGGSAQCVLSTTWYENADDEITSLMLQSSDTNPITAKFRLYKRNPKINGRGVKLIHDRDFNGSLIAGQDFKNIKNNKMYEIVLSNIITDGVFKTLRMQFNGDDAGNYTEQYMIGRITSLLTGVNAVTGVFATMAHHQYPGYARILLMPFNNGGRRVALKRNEYDYDDTLTDYFTVNSGSDWWGNLDDDIHTFTIIQTGGSGTVTGNIKIYEIDLPEKSIEEVEGKVLWYDPSQEGYANDENVTSLSDRSGNGNHATNAATAPIFKTNIINGHPVVRFDGTANCYMNFTSALALDDLEIFIIGQDIKVATGSVFMGDKDLGDCYVYNAPAGYCQVQIDSQVATSGSGTGATTKNNFHLFQTFRESDVFYAGANGYYPNPSRTDSTTWDSDSLGAHTDTQYNLEGDIAEVIVFDRKLSTADRTVVQKYLRKKYDLDLGNSR